MMKYKHFVASIDFDNESNIIYGEILNVLDFVMFQGNTIAELRQAFEKAADDYINYTAMRAAKDGNSFSGIITLQLSSELHHHIARHALKDNLQINQWIEKALWQGVSDKQ